VSISATTWQLERGVTAASDGTADRTFIEELFALHHAEIYAYIFRMVRDADIAADFAQDTFIKAYKAQGSLEDRAKARAWLYQIAHRVVLDEMRRRRIIRFMPWTGESHGAALRPSIWRWRCGSRDRWRARWPASRSGSERLFCSPKSTT